MPEFGDRRHAGGTGGYSFGTACDPASVRHAFAERGRRTDQGAEFRHACERYVKARRYLLVRMGRQEIGDGELVSLLG